MRPFVSWPSLFSGLDTERLAAFGDAGRVGLPTGSGMNHATVAALPPRLHAGGAANAAVLTARPARAFMRPATLTGDEAMCDIDLSVYDESPEQYDTFQAGFLEHGSPLVTAAFQEMFGALGLASGQRILEVGVGTGLNLPLYPAGARVVGIDRSEPMLNLAKKRAGQVQAEVELLLGDASQLPFDSESFDAILCSYVLCSCLEPKTLLQEMVRVVKHGGKIGLFDFHKGRTNTDLIADQFLLRETMKRGLVSSGKPVAVCDTFYDLNEHLPTSSVEVIFDRHLEQSFAQAFRATTLKRL